MEADENVPENQDLIIEGSIHHASEVCRRLLRAESALVRLETAQLVLERLRENKSDTKDDVNMLLRMLSNHVNPTREFMEELLSFLYFSDHRVLLIHHLSRVSFFLFFLFFFFPVFC